MAIDYIRRMLAENEKIILISRQHWFVFLSSILVELVITLALIAIAAVVSIFFPLLAWLGVVVALVLLLVPIMGGLHDFMVWWNRQYIVTNRRVIQISGIFNKNVTDSSLEKVNDVKMEQSAMGRMFNFGDVEIMTGSELGVNKFRLINDPIHFKTAMMNAKARLEQAGNPVHDEEDDVPTLIEKLDALRRRGIITQLEFDEKKARLLAKM